MSFRKRNTALAQSGVPNTPNAPKPTPLPGIRPSPISGTQITSTGTASLDRLLAVGGLALGSSLLIEEEGTTDFSSSLLRCFAAEGVLQGHAVFAVAPEGSMILPGEVEEKGSRGKSKEAEEKMKIAWRYERLGAFEGRERGIPQRQPGALPTDDSDSSATETTVFCHAFDLTKRLSIPSTSIPLIYLSPAQTLSETSPFNRILVELTTYLTSNPQTPTRLLIPSLLSPLFYSPSSSQPHHLLSFIHALRSLLRTIPTLTIMISWPLALYPRTLPLVRWVETLLDGAILLQPFPHAYSIDSEPTAPTSGGDAKDDEKMQGLLKVLKAPVLSERGAGVGGLGVGNGEDMAFAVGRKRFIIRPFHLPPVEGEEETVTTTEEKKKAKDLEF
ncbi:gb [Venturia nashicola]|uniref:Elongator complex protein 4 n=1 Tax=Venturia nashicola TaxID=86259 RepID=A0A4Z1PAM1_9PEZI|nr:gb [Venturia nashicola]